MSKIILFFLYIFTTFIVAQSKVIINEVESINDINLKTIEDEQNKVVGYYYFNEVEKMENKNRLFHLSVFDSDLNTLFEKKIEMIKRTHLKELYVHQNKVIMLLANPKENEMQLIVSDFSNHELINEKIKLKEEEESIFEQYQMNKEPNIAIIEGKGFVFLVPKQLSKISRDEYEPSWHRVGTEFRYYDNNADLIWKSPYSKLENYNSFVYFNDVKRGKVSYTEFRKKDGEFSPMNTIFNLLDVEKNEIIAKVEYPRLTNNRIIDKVFIGENETTILGRFWKNDRNPYAKEGSKGLFINKIKNNGNLIFDKNFSWEDDFSKYIDITKNGRIRKEGSLYPEFFFKDELDNYYIINELYENVVNVATFLVNTNMSTFRVGSICAIKFDPTFNISKVQIIPKELTKRIVSILGTSTSMAKYYYNLGYFDLIGSTNNKITYLDKKRNDYTIIKLALSNNDINVTKEKLEGEYDDFYIRSNNESRYTLVRYIKKSKQIILELKNYNLK